MNLPLIAAAAAFCVLAGLALAIASFTIPPPSHTTRRATPNLKALDALSGRTRRILIWSTIAGVIAALLTGWPVLFIAIPTAALGLPFLFDANSEKKALQRVEAMGKWVSALAGSLGGGNSLEQALRSSLRSTSDEIKPEVSRLVARVNSRIPIKTALRAFADELDDAMGDKIVAALMLGAERRGAALSGVLHDLATSLEDDLRARRSVAASHSAPRTTARGITVLMLVVTGFMFTRADFAAAYRTPLGQLILLVLLAAYALLLYWMGGLAAPQKPPRFLSRTAAGEPTP